jgi:hypothetical protein
MPSVDDLPVSSWIQPDEGFDNLRAHRRDTAVETQQIPAILDVLLRRHAQATDYRGIICADSLRRRELPGLLC